jgi:hypothetical protein
MGMGRWLLSAGCPKKRHHPLALRPRRLLRRGRMFGCACTHTWLFFKAALHLEGTDAHGTVMHIAMGGKKLLGA